MITSLKLLRSLSIFQMVPNVKIAGGSDDSSDNSGGDIICTHTAKVSTQVRTRPHEGHAHIIVLQVMFILCSKYAYLSCKHLHYNLAMV